MKRAVAIALLLAACAPAVDPSAALLGGDGTVFDDSDEAFNYPARNLPAEQRVLFQIGDGVFNRNWITAPATPQGNDGLGPTFNALSCSGCHSNNGRGEPPSGGQPMIALLMRLSVPGSDAHRAPLPVPAYGDQLQERAILGVPGEGHATVEYSELPDSYTDGEPYSLRMPRYQFQALAFGPLPADVLVSPRIAPQMVGLGLLEAVGEQTIEGFAAQNGGRPNHVWDVARQQTVLGRFGWKANQPTLAQQSYAAFRGDIGITSTVFPTKNCPPAQTACAAAPQSPTQPNLQGIAADSMVAHALGLAVPARRRLDDSHARHGEQLFAESGCASCHVPLMTTGTLDGWPALSHQTIRPFTDLLLHDLGPGLADGRPDFEASGSEWRTPPLWGLGLVPAINDHLFLLHDGRARGFAEAILWHGGQAESSKQAFRALPRDDREDLLAFLNSL